MSIDKFQKNAELEIKPVKIELLISGFNTSGCPT